MVRRSLLFGALLLVAGGLAACHGAPHLTFLVTSGADAGDADPGDGVCEATTATADCTLRAAIDEVNARSQIEPAGTRFTIVLGTDVTLSLAGPNDDANLSGDLDLAASAQIQGDGHTIDGAGIDRVLDVRPGPHVVGLHDLTITGGANAGEVVSFPTITDSSGGGVLAGAQTTLNVSNTVFEGNRTLGWGLCVDNSGLGCGMLQLEGGGAIRSLGTLNVITSTFHDNATTPKGSSVYCEASPFGPVCVASWGGAIVATGPTTIRLSTFTENQNRVERYAFFDGAAAVYAPGATIDRSTFVDNVDDTRVGMIDPSESVTGTTPRGSILVDARCAAPSIDLDWNLVSPGGCPSATPDDGGMGPLTDNGGPTPTHLPAATSPAVDAVPAGTAGLCDGSAPADQRWLARPAGSACDIGAVERQPGD